MLFFLGFLGRGGRLLPFIRRFKGGLALKVEKVPSGGVLRLKVPRFMFVFYYKNNKATSESPVAK